MQKKVAYTLKVTQKFCCISALTPESMLHTYALSNKTYQKINKCIILIP